MRISLPIGICRASSQRSRFLRRALDHATVSTRSSANPPGSSGAFVGNPRSKNRMASGGLERAHGSRAWRHYCRHGQRIVPHREWLLLRRLGGHRRFRQAHASLCSIHWRTKRLIFRNTLRALAARRYPERREPNWPDRHFRTGYDAKTRPTDLFVSGVALAVQRGWQANVRADEIANRLHIRYVPHGSSRPCHFEILRGSCEVMRPSRSFFRTRGR
jgi:hypothetical protein